MPCEGGRDQTWGVPARPADTYTLARRYRDPVHVGLTSRDDLLRAHYEQSEEARVERLRVAQGCLPDRYAEPWAEPFLTACAPALQPGVQILDVGSGRRPTLAPEDRPSRCCYVGLDISTEELDAAPPASYDDTISADVVERLPELSDRFDLILTWQVLEHVSSLPPTLENFHGYLRPGGRLVSLLSGRYALFALVARVFPYRLGVAAMSRLLGSEPEIKFPTRYDHCYYSALENLLSGWSSHEIIPRYKGGVYFRFSRTIERGYLAYENWVYRKDLRNLATHYVLTAVR